MARRTFRVPLPHAGMNTDAALTGLDANEAPFLLNAIVNEPGHVRPRHGLRSVRNISAALGTPATDACVSSMSIGDRMLTSWMSRADAAAARHPQTRRASSDALPPALVNTPYMVADRRGVSATLINGLPFGITGMEVQTTMPYGPTAPFENSVFGVSLKPSDDLSGWRAPDWTAAAYVTTYPIARPTRLMRWGGSLSLQGPTPLPTGSLNNGATVGSFSANFPAADALVGMFFIDIPAGFTQAGRTVLFPYNYVYQVIANTTTSFTIDRPFGIGATTTQVPNLAAATLKFWSFAVIPNAPLEIGHVALHKDRIFTGQLYSTFSVAGVPKGRAVNAIQWSQVGEPNIWPTPQILSVDDRSDEAITGLASVGNGSMLLIFKPTRTFALVGDDESNFEVRLINGHVGCVDSNGIVPYQGGVIFPSEKSLYHFDGAQFIDLCQTRPGHGVRSTYHEGLYGLSGTTQAPSPRSRRVHAAVTQDDYLLIHQWYDFDASTGTEVTGRIPLALHLPTRAWTRWQSAAAYGSSQLDRFVAYADQPGTVLYVHTGNPNNYNGRLVDAGRAFGSRYATQVGLPGFFGPATLGAADEVAAGDTSVLLRWAGPYFLLANGDLVQIVAMDVEYLRYDPSGAADDLNTSGVVDTAFRVHLRTNAGAPIGNRLGWQGNVLASGNTNIAEYDIPARASGADDGDMIDQRYMRQRLVQDRLGAITLPMSAYGLQLGVELSSASPASAPNEEIGNRIYGLRLVLEDTVERGYDK